MSNRLGTEQKPLQGSVLLKSETDGKLLFSNGDVARIEFGGQAKEFSVSVGGKTFLPGPGTPLELINGGSNRKYALLSLNDPKSLNHKLQITAKAELFDGTVKYWTVWVAPASKQKIARVDDQLPLAVAMPPDFPAGDYGWDEHGAIIAEIDAAIEQLNAVREALVK